MGGKKLAFGLAATLIAVTVTAGALVLSSRGGSTQTAAPAITATETPAAQPATSQDRSTDRPQPKPSKNDPLLMTNVNGDQYGNAVGDCYDDDFNQVDCAMKHYYEFYAFAEIQAHDLPDEGVILESAGDFCGARLIEYVGDSHAGIPTGMHFWWPFDQEEWDNGRRHISCYVESIPPVRGSVRDG